MTDILMPALSPTMEEGKLAKWLVKEGDTVKPGDVIAEIETDKATMEVEAVDEGVISKLMIPAGTEGVKVNAVIAQIGGDAGAAGAEQGEWRAGFGCCPCRLPLPNRRPAMTGTGCGRRRSLRRRPRGCTIRRCRRG